ncbi:MAG: MmgE/PrpD family protein [Eubacteriales bacterium]
MNINITDTFINDIYNLTQETFNDSVILQAKKCFLDYLGVTLAGAKMLGEKGEKIINSFKPDGNAIAIGFNRKTNIQSAALINGISAHIAELDDGERYGRIHLGAPIISALISIVKHEEISGEDFFKAIIVGYEVAVRIARTIQPSHKELGYHATGTCGTIGAAIAVAVALNYTKAEIKEAFSVAVTGAQGVLKVQEDESELKPLNAGRAALNALLATFVARAGFKGPNNVLSGDRGFLSMVAAKHNTEYLVEKQGEKPFIEKAYMKPYAACRHSHSAIDAAIKLKLKHNIDIKRIRSIQVSTYRWAVRGHDHKNIQGVASAKMSIPYSVALALKLGKVGIQEYMPSYLEDTSISSLTKKVDVFVDDKLTDLAPQKRAAIVKIITNEHRIYEARVDYPKGEPENPMTKEELENKFISLAKFAGKSKKEIEEIMKYVWNLESSLHDLYNVL